MYRLYGVLIVGSFDVVNVRI